MLRDRRNRYGDERITLRQAVIIAVALHLMLGGIVQWKPDLLWSQPLPAERDSRPLEFRFVDVPAEAAEDTPDTEILSDIDRVAADASERDDADDPFAEGNTPQEVLRSDSLPPVPAPQPAPTSAPAPESAAPATPDTEPSTAETRETAPEREAVVEERPAEETVTPPEATAGPAPLATAAPALPPPRMTSLRESLARGVQQYVRPEVFTNSDGGVDGPQGLVSFDTKGFDLGPYLAEVLRIIERNWKGNIPPAARWRGQEGAVFVNLSIVRDPSGPAGERAIIVVSQTWSSGKPAFDQSALFALQISSPLPPLPSYFPYDSLDGRLGFLYNLDPSEVTFPPQR